jgi:hypothetical protein
MVSIGGTSFLVLELVEGETLESFPRIKIMLNRFEELKDACR